ncbi:uncharacterized protein PV07_03812 [Cladophialophora immunda]|uniref:Zn(2)-C6 fungal-type domain-containing protein n=1 Tax=Cladophialophora immunda TaxID=569365 RepID=A0A0D2B3R3_9EURO|nr:uncharacterized protein PV07_03812 [Cladophialophora immunda]KIW32252.1 hypothetical protein PV07_03812 [Cladophialophora immunda]OQV03683.1 Fungal specific transcription factor domain-containing protein [Cladophialophora immunda]
MEGVESGPTPIPLANKDCRVCNRRRIHCDRALPFCAKCARKGVQCPGYGPRFRWTNAIAIRGRFKGRGAPNLSNQGQSLDFEPQSLQKINEEGIPAPTSQFGLALAQQLPPSAAKRLLQYYATNIAPLMVWLDSEKNEYKRLVIPLAEKDTILRLAVLTISAEHMPHEDHLPPGFSRSTGEAAILMITERVRQMTECSMDDPQIDVNGGITAGILAAMLILSNHSLLKSELSHAQSHRQAARILMNSLALKRPPDDDLTIFLKNQLAIYDVLACTTLFNYDHVEHAVLPHVLQQDVPFGDFLNILHHVTVMSLRNFKNTKQAESLEEEFKLARGSTLLAAGTLTQTLTQSSRRDFIRLVEAYHHAGILYAYTRLYTTPTDDERAVGFHTDELFKVLDQFEDINSSLHNLAWPLFIAGTSCSGDKKRMEIISRLCRMLSTNTRFEHYANLSVFLQELWQSSTSDWTLLARQWERKGTPVIAV